MVFGLPKPSTDLLDIIVNTVQPDNVHIKELATKINNFYLEQKQSDSDAEERAHCVNMVREYLKSDNIKTDMASQGIKIRCLTVFGSFATQCASKDSDLDLCVCAAYESKKKPLAVTVLQSIYRDLTYNNAWKSFFAGYNIYGITFVQTAKIPIIRFNINSISVDMSASFDKSPPRSSLAAKYINAYCQLDDRFKVLVTFLKHWLKSEGNPTTHLRDFPNSYSIILMLIHVLQWFDILPNLHKTHSEMFQHKNYDSWDLVDIGHDFKFPLDEHTIAMHRKRRSKNYTVSQLLYLFSCQYSEETIMRYYRFNMKSGDVEGRSARGTPIEIVDVFDSRNPGRTAQSVFHLMGATDLLRKKLAFPHRRLFETILKITTERTYLAPTRYTFGVQPMYNLPSVHYTPRQQSSAPEVVRIQNQQDTHQRNQWRETNHNNHLTNPDNLISPSAQNLAGFPIQKIQTPLADLTLSNLHIRLTEARNIYTVDMTNIPF